MEEVDEGFTRESFERADEDRGDDMEPVPADDWSMTWTLNDAQVYLLGLSMKKYGDSFVGALGEALHRADIPNQRKILNAFPTFVVRYGPGTEFYERIERQEASNG